MLRDTVLSGVVIIEPRVHLDVRGTFSTHYSDAWFLEQGLESSFRQASTSRNGAAGTLRGMHWQGSPYPEVKLVRCDRGAVYDVVLDMRPDSPTFRRWHALELSEENDLAVYVPAGCAHGYQTLRPDSWVTYLLSGTYEPSSARGVRWDDPAFAIEWPACRERVISHKDATYPEYQFDE